MARSREKHTAMASGMDLTERMLLKQSPSPSGAVKSEHELGRWRMRACQLNGCASDGNLAPLEKSVPHSDTGNLLLHHLCTKAFGLGPAGSTDPHIGNGLKTHSQVSFPDHERREIGKEIGMACADTVEHCEGHGFRRS